MKGDQGLCDGAFHILEHRLKRFYAIFASVTSTDIPLLSKGFKLDSNYNGHNFNFKSRDSSIELCQLLFFFHGLSHTDLTIMLNFYEMESGF